MLESQFQAGARVEPVADGDALQTWCEVMCASFELPRVFAEGWYDSWRSLGFSPPAPFRHYLGFVDEEPVATSTVIFGAGVAGIYNVGTQAAVRGHGIGTALTLAPLLEARELGFRVAITHASEMAVDMYRHLGFREYCSIGQYVWAES